MSSVPTSSNIQLIFDAALSDYSKQTGIDLSTYPFAQDLQDCRSADDLLNVLQDRAKQFQTYRDGNRKLINCLKPVVRILHTLSGFLAEATAVVSLPSQSVLSHQHVYAPGSRFPFNPRKPFSLVSMFSSPCVPVYLPSLLERRHCNISVHLSGCNRRQCKL
jgi:hypothetical protein